MSEGLGYDLVFNILSAAAAGGGAYAAVRTELRYIREAVEKLEKQLTWAHRRIDQLHLRTLSEESEP